MRVVIVGGVAGGASAAARLRRLAESAEILLFERGGEPSFANCGMPYYIGGEIRSREKLLVTPVERLRTRYRLDVRTRTEVTEIDRERKVITARELATGRTYEEAYDRLILSPGAQPLKPQLPGLDLPGVVSLRDLRDADAIKSLVDDGAKSAVVIGGGFIGLEMVENFLRRGLQTTLVQRDGQILTPWDREMTTDASAHLREHGVKLLLRDELLSVSQAPAESKTRLRLLLRSGIELSADLLLLSIGVQPDNRLAVDAGLEIGPRGGIRVNAQQQTSDPHIYAVGDVVEVEDALFRNKTQVALAGPANRQGRLAADHICGRTVAYRGTQGTAVLRVCEMTLALTGASEKTLQRLGVPYRAAYIHPAHHAGYYPGAEGMTLKILFAPDSGKILGAQGSGRTGVDKRIDVLAVAIQAGMTVFDLEQTELCYSPQYGSAKDPINMLGFLAAGIVRGDHPQLTAGEYIAGGSDDVQLLDVRTPEEHARGAIPAARNIPVDELRQRLGELSQERPVVAYCQVGMRGYLATRILLQSGFRVRNLSGGYQSYLQHTR